MLEFRYGDIEFRAQAVFQAAEYLALILERLRMLDVKLESKQTDGHARLRRREVRLPAAGGRSCIDVAFGGGFRGRNLGDLEAFQNVADFHVVKVGDARAALEAGANFADVVLKAFQGTKLGGVNHSAITQHANLAVTLEHAIHNVAAGDGAGALDTEGVANFGATQVGFGDDGFEQAFHGLFNFVGNFVNDGVSANVDMFLLREIGGLAIGANSKSDDNRPGCGSEEQVVFGDGAHPRADDFELHLIGGKLGQHFAENFDGALHVGLDDDAEFLDVASFQLLMQLIEGDARAAAASHLRVTLLALAVFDDVASLGFVSDLEVVACIRNALQAENFNGRGRRRVDYRTAAIIEHGAHFAEDRSADEKVAGFQGAVLYQDSGDRAAAFVDAGFENSAAGGSVRIGFEFAKIGNQQNGFEQFVETDFLLGAHFHKFGVAAPLGGHQAVFG